MLVGSKVCVEKGCASLGITKGRLAKVMAIDPLGADYSHQVRVSLQFLVPTGNGRTARVFYAVHMNRLADPLPALHGNVSGQRILVRPLA